MPTFARHKAQTPIEIARARELCRFTRWDAERRLPHLFGQQTKIVNEVGEDLGDLLREARMRVVNATVAQLPAPDENKAK